jgi:hypothetical protein
MMAGVAKSARRTSLFKTKEKNMKPVFIATMFLLTAGVAAEPYTCRNGAFPSYPEIHYGEVMVSADQRAAVFPDREAALIPPRAARRMR